MRWLALVLGLAVSAAAVAQETPKKKKKAPAAKKEQPAAKHGRGKPTPEQIRRFNELQKKK